MELILIGMTIALVATGVDIYCVFSGTSADPVAQTSDEAV
jgi:hypothetical protein